MALTDQERAMVDRAWKPLQDALSTPAERNERARRADVRALLTNADPAKVADLLDRHEAAQAERQRREAVGGEPVGPLDGELPAYLAADIRAELWAMAREEARAGNVNTSTNRTAADARAEAEALRRSIERDALAARAEAASSALAAFDAGTVPSDQHVEEIDGRRAIVSGPLDLGAPR